MRGTEYFESHGFVMRPRISVGRKNYAYWRRLSPDSVELNWTTGFTGVHIRAKDAADSLSGIAQAWIDAGEGMPFPTADFMARRIGCGAAADSR